MSELRSVVEELRAEALASVPDARLLRRTSSSSRPPRPPEAERLRRLAELSRRGLFERDGHLSAAGWLVASYDLLWAQTREAMRFASVLEQMPVTARALAEGGLSLSAARELSRAFESEPEGFASSEEHPVGSDWR